MSGRPRKKGVFGREGLTIARGYLRPGSHGRLLWLGLLLGLLALGGLFLATRMGAPAGLSAGPLSTAHATLTSDCSTCHVGRSRVTAEACSSCHEKLGDDLGLYTWAAHYVYRSGDFQRVTTHEGETPCASCHPEHRGRDADLRAVADQRCLGCHEGTSFSSDHPQFDFVAEGDAAADDDTLRFAHGHHVRRVMERAGLADLERACLACHRPDETGRGFEAVDFDRSCDACHLQAGVATARLPLAVPGDEETEPQVGVLSLETIRASGEPDTRWSLFLDPAELRTAGSRVVKTPLHHRDPWILYNLRRLRRMLYPDAGLADLLVAAPGEPSADVRELYREAADTLEEQITGLRGTPDAEVQAQLAEMEALLARVRRALEDPSTPLDETDFLLAFGSPADLPPGERDEIEALVGDLTQPCAQCHAIENASIARVEEAQQTLRRAEFDHRAHVIQRRCLDCHHRIPILDAVGGAELPPEVDRAGIHNLPGIESCRECHRSDLASTSCVGCHLFHPDPTRQASLLLDLEER